MALSADATLAELQKQVFEPWATYLRWPRPPSHKTTTNWAWESQKNGFPAPVADVLQNGRWVRTYDVAEVLLWYVRRPAPQGRHWRARG